MGRGGFAARFRRSVPAGRSTVLFGASTRAADRAREGRYAYLGGVEGVVDGADRW